MNALMKAVMFYAPGDLRLMETPIPSAGPGEVVVKIKAALTCGTDFKAYRQGHPVLLARTPSPFGHEMAGVISEVGSDLTTLRQSRTAKRRVCRIHSRSRAHHTTQRSSVAGRYELQRRRAG